MNDLDLPETLKLRINQINGEHNVTSRSSPPQGSFVLYLPTVVLRKQHNPAFALACRLSNHYHVPLIVMAVVLDDSHIPETPSTASSTAARPTVVMTCRRLAFLLEALQAAAREWETHGAGVAVRVHGPQLRTPHHLTLARKSVAVVTDEPFVHPFLSFCQTVERATQSAGIPCFRVDGSTTVPPVSILQRQMEHGNTVGFMGVPTKAWMWQKKTESLRRAHVFETVKNGHLDAPELVVKVEPNFFQSLPQDDALVKHIPEEWRNAENAAPGYRPWTVEELSMIRNLKEWTLLWPGADASVPPCHQTHGSESAGQERWNNFRRNHLSTYAKLRNQIQKPHAVSRMSCYLNYGIVSIFQVIYDLWQATSTAGSQKFEEEIVKWREMSYAHAFAAPRDYNRASSVPQWAVRDLSRCRQHTGASSASYSIDQLERGQTDCEKWNAMQQYLVRTGELHNNCRMTWGKTMVHWQKGQHSTDDILNELVYLNDRYALDGLSPPSYAGILWCLGWCDKPKDGRLSQKRSSQYRTGPEGFREAERLLFSETTSSSQRSITDMLPPMKKQRSEAENMDSSIEEALTRREQRDRTLLRYFNKKSNPKPPEAPFKTIG